MGYVGLVQGVIMADFGADVICMDIDKEKIEILKKGIVPIFDTVVFRSLLTKNIKAKEK